MKILAINFGGLGDEVLFLPTLASIKTKYPSCHLCLLTEPRGKAIAQLTELIDENLTFDVKKAPLSISDYAQLVNILRQGQYDIIISSGSSSRVAFLLFLSGIKTKIGYDSGLWSRFLLTRAVSLNCEQYAAYMYHDLVQGLGIKEKPEAPHILVKQEDITKMESLLNGLVNVSSSNSKQEFTKKQVLRILIHPGSSYLAAQKGIIKTWSAGNWCLLIEKLLIKNHQVLLCGGPEDNEVIEEISTKISSHIAAKNLACNFYNLAGLTKSIRDLVGLMAISNLVICVDSAPMHIAASLKRPLIALFGPTDPEKLLLQDERTIAIQDNSYATYLLANKNISKKAINKVKRSSLDISPDLVYQHVENLLRNII